MQDLRNQSIFWRKVSLSTLILVWVTSNLCLERIMLIDRGLILYLDRNYWDSQKVHRIWETVKSSSWNTLTIRKKCALIAYLMSSMHSMSSISSISLSIFSNLLWIGLEITQYSWLNLTLIPSQALDHTLKTKVIKFKSRYRLDYSRTQVLELHTLIKERYKKT